MAVPTEARQETKLTALIEARKLVKYSVKVLQNNNHFKQRPSGNEADDMNNPPQPEIVSAMRSAVVEAYTSAYSANETPFTADNYRHRRQLQDKSIAKLNELLALLEMSIPIFHIPARRFGFWGNFIVCVRNRIQAWKESDYKRYKRMRADAERAAPVG